MGRSYKRDKNGRFAGSGGGSSGGGSSGGGRKSGGKKATSTSRAGKRVANSQQGAPNSSPKRKPVKKRSSISRNTRAVVKTVGKNKRLVLAVGVTAGALAANVALDRELTRQNNATRESIRNLKNSMNATVRTANAITGNPGKRVGRNHYKITTL